jgi:hypothetical protein
MIVALALMCAVVVVAWLRHRSKNSGLTGAESLGIALEVRAQRRAARAGHAGHVPSSRLARFSRGGF